MQVFVDFSEIKKMAEKYKNGKTLIKKAQTMWLNNLAYATQNNIVDFQKKHMIIRNEGFLRRSVKYKKAHSDIGYMTSFVGSLRRDRFTGWAEQQGINLKERKKTITLSARNKNKNDIVRYLYRSKNVSKMKNPEQYSGPTRRKRANQMLYEIGRSRSQKPFFLFGHRRLPTGIWKFGGSDSDVGYGRDLIPLEIFGEKPKKTRRNNWMIKSYQKTMKNVKIKKIIDFILQRIKPR